MLFSSSQQTRFALNKTIHPLNLKRRTTRIFVSNNLDTSSGRCLLCSTTLPTTIRHLPRTTMSQRINENASTITMGAPLPRLIDMKQEVVAAVKYTDLASRWKPMLTFAQRNFVNPNSRRKSNVRTTTDRPSHCIFNLRKRTSCQRSNASRQRCCCISNHDLSPIILHVHAHS